MKREGGNGGASGSSDAELTERVAIDSKGEGQAVLSAQTVFDELIQALGLEAPPILSDPLNFFAEDMARQLSAEEETTDANLIYGIDGVIARIRSAREREEDTEQAGAGATLEAVRNALRSSRYKDAIQDLATLQTDDLNENQREEAANASWTAGRGLLDNSEEELLAYELTVKFADAMASLDVGLQESVAKSLVYAGMTLRDLERIEEAVSVYDDVVKRFGDAKAFGLRSQVANALFNKGVGLNDLERGDEALAAYGEVVEQYGDAAETELRVLVAMALVNTGVGLAALERGEEAIVAYGRVEERFGDATEAELREQVARAMVGMGLVLGELDRNEEAVASYSEMVKRFGDATEPTLRQFVAMAMVNKGYRLKDMDRMEDALAVFDQLVERFGDAVELDIEEQVAKALLNKGFTLDAMDRNEEAVAAYEEVVARFGDAEAQILRDQVAHAKAQIESAKSETEEPPEDE